MADPQPSFGSAVRRGGNSRAPMAIDSPDSYRQQSELSTPASWAVMGNVYQPVPDTTKKLPAGFYACKSSMRGPYFELMDITTDGLLRLPDKTTDMLLHEFVTFWERIDKFAHRGLSPKRGIMLWGPPGSGKTSAVQVMAQHMIDALDGVVVMAAEPETTAALLAGLRTIEPTRPIIVVYEDLDALVERFGEAQFLAMLDGELQVADVVNVATTNYPELLDARFIDRPGRFDRVQYVGMPTEEARRCYLKARLTEIEPGRLERWVDASDGWSIAHLRELVVATDVLGESDDATIDRVDDMRVHPSSDAPPGKRNGVGFHAS